MAVNTDTGGGAGDPIRIGLRLALALGQLRSGGTGVRARGGRKRMFDARQRRWPGASPAREVVRGGSGHRDEDNERNKGGKIRRRGQRLLVKLMAAWEENDDE